MPHNPGDNTTVSLGGDDAAEPRGYFEELSDGGKAREPARRRASYDRHVTGGGCR
ncbi:hypothetical protein ACQPYE_19375 [Actinosynnema sp. CA-299493]